MADAKSAPATAAGSPPPGAVATCSLLALMNETIGSLLYTELIDLCLSYLSRDTTLYLWLCRLGRQHTSSGQKFEFTPYLGFVLAYRFSPEMPIDSDESHELKVGVKKAEAGIKDPAVSGKSKKGNDLFGLNFGGKRSMYRPWHAAPEPEIVDPPYWTMPPSSDPLILTSQSDSRMFQASKDPIWFVDFNGGTHPRRVLYTMSDGNLPFERFEIDVGDTVTDPNAQTAAATATAGGSAGPPADAAPKGVAAVPKALRPPVTTIRTRGCLTPVPVRSSGSFSVNQPTFCAVVYDSIARFVKIGGQLMPNEPVTDVRVFTDVPKNRPLTLQQMQQQQKAEAKAAAAAAPPPGTDGTTTAAPVAKKPAPLFSKPGWMRGAPTPVPLWCHACFAFGSSVYTIGGVSIAQAKTLPAGAKVVVANQYDYSSAAGDMVAATAAAVAAANAAGVDVPVKPVVVQLPSIHRYELSQDKWYSDALPPLPMPVTRAKALLHRNASTAATTAAGTADGYTLYVYGSPQQTAIYCLDLTAVSSAPTTQQSADSNDQSQPPPASAAVETRLVPTVTFAAGGTGSGSGSTTNPWRTIPLARQQMSYSPYSNDTCTLCSLHDNKLLSVSEDFMAIYNPVTARWYPGPKTKKAWIDAASRVGLLPEPKKNLPPFEPSDSHLKNVVAIDWSY